VGTAQLLGQICSWAITIVVIRLLSPADYGLLAMATVFVEFFGMMAQFGVGAAIVQAPVISERELRQMFGVAIVVNVGLFIAMYLGAPLIAVFFGDSRLVEIVRVLAVPFLMGIFAMIPGAQLSRKLDYKTLSLIGLTSAIAASLTTLALALMGAGVWSLVWGSLVAAGWSTVSLNLVSPFLKWPEFSYRGARALILFGGNVTITRILWFWYSQSDIIIAGKLLGEELLGSYSVSMNLASSPAGKLSNIVNQVSFPAFGRIRQDRERYASNFLLAVRLLSFVVFPVLWGISSIAPELVQLLLGGKWLAVTVPLQLLALIMPVHMFAPFMNTAADAMGRADISTKQVFIASIVMPVAFLIGCQWGLVGLALAWIIAFPVVFAAAMVLFLPIIGLRVRDLLMAMAPPVCACAGMYGAVTLARPMLGSEVNDVLRMTVLVLTGVATYGALTAIFSRDRWREVIRTLWVQRRMTAPSDAR
jgi:O-antigen/teichoic acid export membrane protein